MRFRLPRRRSDTLRDLARQRPEEAEAYLDTHQDEWEALAEDHPHNAADILEALREADAADLLADLDTEEAAEVLDEMRPEAAADIIEQLDPAAAAAYIAEMDTDQAVDLLGALEDEVRESVIAALSDEEAEAVNRLLQYPTDTAGGLMTTEIATLPMGVPAGEAIEILRQLHEELGSNMVYVYVVDDAKRLQGVVSFRDLVFARPGTALEEVMVESPVAVTTATDREVVAELIQRYHLLAIPVTDEAGHLVGMVRFDEALEAVQAEVTEDITTMVGAGAEETVFTPIRRSVSRRLPWISVNLGIGLMIALVISRFESVIEGNEILAAYMPMVALLAGNSGAQSLAVVIRAMAVGELPAGRAVRAIRREGIIGLVNGAVISVMSGVGGALLTGNAELGLVITIAVAVNFLVAGVAGAGIPVLLRSLGQDPALASNIFLTMITDVVGFGGFLLTATILL
jgi:magnesium transporter